MHRLIPRSATAVLLLLVATASAETVPTIESNFRYRQSWGELGTPGIISSEPADSTRALHLTGDVATILRLCENSPKWQKDPIIFRLAHKNPGSSIGCREKASPSVHAVFYKKENGEREAWVHFDLHGPQNPIVHLTEVFRNRMTFGRTSEYEVYRGLLKSQHAEFLPPPRYDLGEHAKQYLKSVIGPRAISSAVASGSSSLTLRKVMGADTAGRTYHDRILLNLAQNGVSQSIEFGTAAFLQQDQTFHTSREGGFVRRSRAALHNAFFVPGREGEELAFPRIAAALGTPWVMRPWHPGQIAPPNPWLQSVFMMGRYIARSYWAEFKPDFQRALRRTFHTDRGLASLAKNSQ